jgi:hypothetical protein
MQRIPILKVTLDCTIKGHTFGQAFVFGYPTQQSTESRLLHQWTQSGRLILARSGHCGSATSANQPSHIKKKMANELQKLAQDSVRASKISGHPVTYDIGDWSKEEVDDMIQQCKRFGAVKVVVKRGPSMQLSIE